MKNTQTCPKCQCRRLWVLEELAAVRIVDVFTNEGRIDWPRQVAQGIEAWICAQCGFFESYIKDANLRMQTLAASGDRTVRLIDTTGPKGPFR